MKKVFFTVSLLTLVMFNAFAQSETFRIIEWDFPLAFGYAVPSDGGAGILIFSECRYNMSDQISIGIRPEFSLMGSGGDFSGVSAVGSYSVVGDYYFTSNSIRPFAGTGLGMYKVGDVQSLDEDLGDVEITGGSKLGFSPRVGLELSLFRISAEYNLILGTNGYNPSYLAVKAALTLFGGKKK